jgi:hypothetical protein
MIGILIIFSLFFVGTACKKEEEKTKGPYTYEPKLTKELMPPVLKGIHLGTSTPEEVQQLFSDLKLSKDKELEGGNVKKARYNGKPALCLRKSPWDQPADSQDKSELTFWFTKGDDGVFRLASFSLSLPLEKDSSTCEWIRKHIGSDPKSLSMPGSNRKFGEVGKALDYAAGTVDGKKPVTIRCSTYTRDEMTMENVEFSILSDDLNFSTEIIP